jgi:hypothetical protein
MFSYTILLTKDASDGIQHTWRKRETAIATTIWGTTRNVS